MATGKQRIAALCVLAGLGSLLCSEPAAGQEVQNRRGFAGDRTLAVAGDPVAQPAEASTSRSPAPRPGCLAIAAPYLASSAGLHELLVLRRSQGFDVKLVDTDTTGSSEQDIKAFIQNAYNLLGDPAMRIAR